MSENERFTGGPDPERQEPAVGAAAPAGVAGVPAEPESEAIRRLENEVAELRDRHLRLAAEFDNYRKRVARERVELADRAQAAFVIRLLPRARASNTLRIGTISGASPQSTSAPSSRLPPLISILLISLMQNAEQVKS